MQLTEQFAVYLIPLLACEDHEHRLKGVESVIEEQTVDGKLCRVLWSGFVHAQRLFKTIVEEFDIIMIALLHAKSFELCTGCGDHW